MASSSASFLSLCLLVSFAAPTAAAGHLRLSASAAPAGAIAADATPCEIPPGAQKFKLFGTKHGMEVVMRAGNDIVSEHVAKQGFWEEHSVDDMARKMGGTLPEKGVFLDIGGNMGYYSFLYAAEGWRVITIEPMMFNRRIINATLCLNPHLRDRVTVVATALGTQEDVKRGACTLRWASFNLGNGYLDCGSGPNSKERKVCMGADDGRCEVIAAGACKPGESTCETVPMRTLDEVLAELKPPSVDAVKMDIEGFECHVMAAGSSLLEKYHPRMLKVETWTPDIKQCMKKITEKYGYADKAADGSPDTYYTPAAGASRKA